MPDDQLLNNYTAANIQRQCRGREIEELNRQMSELRAENATLKNEVHEWQESDAATKVLGPAFEEQIAELTRQLNDSQAQVETAGRNAAHYADMSLELEKQVAELTRRRNEAQNEAQENWESVKRLTARAEAGERQAAAMREALTGK